MNQLQFFPLNFNHNYPVELAGFYLSCIQTRLYPTLRTWCQCEFCRGFLKAQTGTINPHPLQQQGLRQTIAQAETEITLLPVQDIPQLQRLSIKYLQSSWLFGYRFGRNFFLINLHCICEKQWHNTDKQNHCQSTGRSSRIF